MAIELKEKDIKFFGEVDRDIKGKIISMYPAWTFETQIDGMNEEKRGLQRQIEMDLIPGDGFTETKVRLEKLKNRLREIEESKPKLSDGEKDRLAKIYKTELVPLIEMSMFSRNEMDKGIADAHEEAKRINLPCLKLPAGCLALAEGCNLRVEKGKASRNQVAKMFKIIGHLLGERTNIEVLRK